MLIELIIAEKNCQLDEHHAFSLLEDVQEGSHKMCWTSEGSHGFFPLYLYLSLMKQR